MSSVWCPRPRYVQYRSGSFCGVITNLHLPDKGLFYALDINFLDKFREIEQFRPKNEFRVPPEYGDGFLYLDKDRCYRGYRLKSNPANKIALRAFLIDIGVEIYRNFAPGTFFKLPIEFQSVPAMAIFCFLKSFPGSELKTEFIEHSFTMIFKFEVEEFTRLKNCLGEAERCLIVNIIDPDQKDEEQQESNGSSGLLFSEIEASTTVGSTSEFQGYIEQVPNAPVKYCSRLTYLRSGKDYTPYMVDRIQIDSSLPSPGSKILICLTEVESPSSIYGTFSEPEDFRRTQESEFMQLSMWMNEVEVKKKFKKFRGELQPIIGEMVITEGKDEHCHRGLVTGVTGSIFTIFFVDFGYELRTSLKTLYKFPREFGTLHFQAVNFTIANVTSFKNESDNVKAVKIMDSELRPVSTGHVISCQHNVKKMEVKVLLYDYDGRNVSDILEGRIGKRLLPEA